MRQPDSPTGFGEPGFTVWEALDVFGKHTLGNVQTAFLTDPVRQPEQMNRVAAVVTELGVDMSPGIGDAKAASAYADAFGEDPEFAEFYRSLKAYRESFKSGSDLIITDPNSDFFQFFKSNKGGN